MKKNTINWMELITNDDSRQHLQFECVFAIMAFISAFMTVLNYFTGWRGALMHATLYFSVLNIVNVLLEFLGGEKVKKVARVLFAVEIVTLFTFFIINGQPKGFSTLWALLMPACGLLLYKGAVGSLIAGIQFVIIIFLFYFPTGRQILNYDYNDVFMMRFPVLYAAFFIVGFFFEIVRQNTQKELSEARDQYRELYAREETRANQEKEINFRVMHVLTDEYKVVMSVEIETGKVEVYSGQTYINPALTGLNFQHAMNLYRNNWVSPNFRDEFEKFFSVDNILETLKYETSAMLTYAVMSKGREHYLQTKIIKIPEESGSIRQIVVAFTDTDTYVREQQKIQKELRVQRSKADSANNAKTDFLFNMSHDIRTPMNAIIGFTDRAVKESENPEKVRENLQKVRLSGNLLLSLVNDILDMSRIESGKVTVDEVRIDMETIFDNTQSMMDNQAAAKNINLRFDVSRIRDRYVYADVVRVDRILVNLVSNAIKYTECNGQVQVSCEQVGDTKPGCGTYRFVVKDNGMGMSEEFQKQMFEEFAREESSTVKGIQGTGLGLPLTKKLTEILGGEISCESKQGVGSTFVITLPFRLQSKSEIEEVKAVVQDEVTVDLSGKKVLLVEDNELNREIASCILEEKGILVETAVNGKDAVRKVTEKGSDYFDFILMDIQMPVMNGYEATEQIRSLYPGAHLPIIALSANAFEEDRRKSLTSGMDDHISKPIDVAILTKTLAKYVKA